ncbi:E3 ubiquitin-protein ligase AIRP2-like [Cynara cardunculus var. scolymus]|uniref:E3 ubiquitin-protein ligase AIRP2-like n=1 Tax=Cynara cardunculus var. scolymus TaxID=59895 RepID=UPI000D627C4D|nr:E3 ubiquitin-protein ligase AIRP2-like [Cynara cardunculus var. scolymus]
MYQKQSNTNTSLFRESIKALEADIRHANTLASTLPPDDGGDSVQMKLSYSTFAPFLLYLIDWMDYSCTDSLPSYLGLLHILVYKVYVDGIQTMSIQERKATLREFYAVIYPSLKQLEGYLIELREDDDNKKISCEEVDRDDECGICMETCDKMALPNCGHSICIGCFRDWNTRSKSCPFCRGSLKKVQSGDLWVLTSESDSVDLITLAKENLRCFYLYIESLPFVVPDTHFLLYEYLI